MVLLDQPTCFKHSIFKPKREFKADAEPEYDNDEEMRIPEVKEQQYLPGERLLKKINKDRKKKKIHQKIKKMSPATVDRISESLSRTVRQLTL